MAVYGLLVAVNYYLSPDIRGLGGCVNDVYLFSQTLQERFGVAEDNLKILTDQEATHDGIIDEFRQHLTRRSWGTDDVALFYFSGHGAQTLAPEIFWNEEPDHLNESLVCHDSRTLDTPDLLDKELRFLIAELAKAGCGHITVILDCCHGGHGTRFVGETVEDVRLAPADMTQYPLERFVFGQQAGKSVDQLTLKELLPESGKHILLSGCQDYQLSIEKLQGSYVDPQRHGLFTYAMCETLSALQYTISYQELRDRIYQRVQKQASTQSPQIEAIAGADVTQKVLGTGLQALRMLAFKDNSGQWKLNAGAMHGLNNGDELALFADDADPSHLANSTGKAVIQQTESFTSLLNISGSKLSGEEYTAILTRQHFPKLPVCLLGDENGVQALRAVLAQDQSPADPGHFLQETQQAARYAIRAEHNTFAVTEAQDTRPLFQTTLNAVEALEQAAIMARWHQKLALGNPASRLDDPVEIIVIYNGQEYTNQDVTLPYTFDGTKWNKPRFNLELRLKPGQPRLYYALLYFDGSTGEISNVLASGGWLSHEGSDQEGEYKAQPVVKAFEGKAIPLKIKDELLAQGITRVQDSLKLIVCEDEFDSSLLNQAALKLQVSKAAQRSLLKNSLERFATDAHNRSLATDDEEPDAAPDWTSRVINITVERPQETRSVSAQQATPLLGQDDVRIEPHPAFRGQVRLVSSQAVSRSVGKAATPEPALFANTGNAFSFSQGRSADMGLDALEIFLDGDPHSVSAQQPLQVSINQVLADGEQLIPYAYDEESQFFLPVGRAEQTGDGRTLVSIMALPHVASAIPADATRSLGSALKIFFRKLVYRDLLKLDVGVQVLGIPVFDATDPTEVKAYETDQETIATRVAQASNILLVIHGIIGHTSTIAGCVNRMYDEARQPIHKQYDLILSFDYENLSTPIEESARALKAQLAQVGIKAGTGKRLDILAHSMGGLVSRWFIEHEDGGEIVNTLLMVGTPNGGSPIATLKAQGYAVLKPWVYGNLLAILNGVTTAYVGGAVIAALVKLLDTLDNALDEMEPASSLIKTLAASPAPQHTRYAVIAGDTSGLMLPADDYTRRLAKLVEYLGKRLKLAAYDLLTEKLFKAEANDIAVSYGSMRHFNPAWKNQVAVEAVCCDHLSYFADKETVQRIAQLLCNR
jgi:pimeloyl-ACP methyl ester carboxylesterase